ARTDPRPGRRRRGPRPPAAVGDGRPPRPPGRGPADRRPAVGRGGAVDERPVRRPVQAPGGEVEPMMTCELALAAGLLAPAQADNKAVTVTGTLVRDRSGSDRRPVDEQIEVMRALLIRRLGRGVSAPATYSWTVEPVETGRAANTSYSAGTSA